MIVEQKKNNKIFLENHQGIYERIKSPIWDLSKRGAACNAYLHCSSIFTLLPLVGSIDTEAIGGPGQLKRCWSREIHNKNVGVTRIQANAYQVCSSI